MRRAVLWAFLVVCAVALGPGCGPRRGDDEKSLSAKDVIVWGRGSDSKGLDPAKEEDGESLKVCDNIYDGLVRYVGERFEVGPALAVRWDISDDGLEYTFHLRSNVRFHDGTPFDSAAVVFHFRRQFDKTHPFYGVGGPNKYWNAMDMDSIVESVDAPDAATVRFRLKESCGVFLQYLTMHFAYIPSPTAIRKYGEQYGKPVSVPAGTGPFKFRDWDKGVRIVLEANADYWGEKPKIKRVIYRPFPDPTARLLSLRSGELDGMQFPELDVLQGMKEDANITQIRKPALNIAYLAMNCSKKPFDDVRVRQAVAYAIDKKVIVEALYGGIGQVAKNPIPPGMPGYNNDIEDYPCDPQKARGLLAAAGYPNGFETDFWYMSNSRPYIINPKEVALLIQSDLRKVGIRAKAETIEWGAYLDYVGKGKHSMALLGWSADIADADNFFGPLLSIPASQPPHAQNIAFYRSEPLQKIIEEARAATNQYRRVELYRDACRIVHDDAPWVPLVHTSQVVLVRSNVHGIKVPVITKIIFNTAWKD